MFLLAGHAAGQADATLYNETNGLPRASIQDIHRDARGIFWLGTERGLIRFDGRNFIEVPPDDPAYRQQEVSRMRLQGDSLYLVYRDSGCMVLDLASLRFRLMLRETVDDILVLPDGDAVASLRSGGLMRRRQGVWRRVRYDARPLNLLALHRGRLFASMPARGLYRIDPSSLLPLQDYGLKPDGFMDGFNATPDRLFHLSNGVLRVFDTGYRRLTTDPLPFLKGANITQFAAIGDGLAYLILSNKRLFEHRDGRLREIPLTGPDNLELKKLWTEDSSHLLIGTNQGLMHVRMGASPITRMPELPVDTNGTIRVRRRILEDADGRLILLGSPLPYTFRSKEGFRPQQMPRLDMYDAVRVGDAMYVTTEGGGLIELDVRRWRYRSIAVPPIDSAEFYISILYDSAGAFLLVGGRDGLIRYDPATGSALRVAIPPGLGPVTCLRKDGVTGRYWLGAENGLCCLAPGPGRVLFLARSGRDLRAKQVGELMVRRGTRELWVGHERGVDIVDMDSMRFRSRLHEGLFRNPRVVSMLEDGEGRVWMGTYSGIVGYDPLQGGFCRLNRENGLLNIEFNYKSALRLANGSLIFGGLNGYDRVDPARIRFSNSESAGMVTGVHRFSTSDTAFESLPGRADALGFDIRAEFLRVYLSSANTLQARRHSYEYDLDGKGQWIGVGDPSYINLLMLDPGLHTLDVRGFDEYGRVLGFGRLLIRAREPFLRSRFFQVLLSLTAIFFLAMFVFVQLRSRRKEKAIKERISMDLHDEVGTTLTRALYVARLDGEGVRDARLVHYLNESLFSLRAYINTMNTPSFAFHSLVDEVKEMVHTLMSPSPAHAEVRHLTDGDYLVRGEVYRDIRLCLYEIINNMLKHSGGDRLRIVLLARRGLLTLYAADNGTLRSTEGMGERGNGVRNLRKRVTKHGGELRLSVGRSGSGLVVRMRFPLRSKR